MSSNRADRRNRARSKLTAPNVEPTNVASPAKQRPRASSLSAKATDTKELGPTNVPCVGVGQPAPAGRSASSSGTEVPPNMARPSKTEESKEIAPRAFAFAKDV